MANPPTPIRVCGRPDRGTLRRHNEIAREGKIEPQAERRTTGGGHEPMGCTATGTGGYPALLPHAPSDGSERKLTTRGLLIFPDGSHGASS
jgi:hypothetical protein